MSTIFVGNYYEKTGSTITKYYYAGATRIGMRKYTIPQSMVVEYFLGDHLGSTSITTDNAGAKVSEMRYKPFGEVRYTWKDATLTQTTPAYALTKWTFTGQYSYADDPSTPGVEDFGLLYFNARFYDPWLGRFSSADTDVPASQGVQAYDRYAFVNNNPVRFTDPSGHWIESALDVAFIAYDIYDISHNGLSWETGLSLAADVAGLALPVVTGGGVAVRAAMHADDAVDAARLVDKAIDGANITDNLADAISHGDDIGERLIRAVPLDQVGTSQPFKPFKGEDGISVFEGVTSEQVLSELPGSRVPNTTVNIPSSMLPPGTKVIPTPATGLSRILSDAHRIIIRPEGWSVDRFAKFLKEIVGWR